MLCKVPGVRDNFQRSYSDINPANYNNWLGNDGTSILRVTKSCKTGLKAHSVGENSDLVL